MYTHAQITSRSLKKSLESAKLKIISSIHRPRDTALEESCRTQQGCFEKHSTIQKKVERTRRVQHSGFGRQWRRKDSVPLASATWIRSLFKCTTSIKLPSWCGCSVRQCRWRIWHLKSNHSHWIFQHGEALAVIILVLSVQQLPVCLIKQQLFPLPSSPSDETFHSDCHSQLSGRGKISVNQTLIFRSSLWQTDVRTPPQLLYRKAPLQCCLYSHGWRALRTMFVFKQIFLQQIILYQHRTFFFFFFLAFLRFLCQVQLLDTHS